MIAALFLVALVASAQAFPGSDPLSNQLVAAKLEKFTSGGGAMCMMGYSVQAMSLVKSVQTETLAAIAIFNEFVARSIKCKTTDDWLVCDAQAIRDTWEGSAEKRAEIAVLVEKVVELAQKVYVDCF